MCHFVAQSFRSSCCHLKHIRKSRICSYCHMLPIRLQSGKLTKVFTRNIGYLWIDRAGPVDFGRLIPCYYCKGKTGFCMGPKKQHYGIPQVVSAALQIRVLLFHKFIATSGRIIRKVLRTSSVPGARLSRREFANCDLKRLRFPRHLSMVSFIFPTTFWRANHILLLSFFTLLHSASS